MRPRSLLALIAIAGCGREPVAAVRRVPATLTTATQPSATAIVGASAGTWTVTVEDAQGEPVSGVLVAFAPSLGGGRVSPAFDTTGADGTASTSLTVGTLPGTNEVIANTAGLTPLKSAQITASAGPSRSVLMNLRAVRLTATQDSVLLTAVPRDTFGNPSAVPVTFFTPNGLGASTRTVSVTQAWLRVVSRPATTWVKATAGAAVDSIAVNFLAPGASPCEAIATDTAIAVGATLEFDGSAVVCLRSPTLAEYVLVSHYNTTTSASVVTATVNGSGTGVPAPFPSGAMSLTLGEQSVAATGSDAAFERSLRLRDREIESRAVGARAWRRGAQSNQASIAATPRVGDRLTVNVNADGFCADPSTLEARIAAISDAAIIVEDVANPGGGFDDADYLAFARTIDTLVYPLDTTAFGAPTDIDGNGRIVVFFTKAVNELTPRASNGVVFGFFSTRDLLPRESPFGNCPGSNVGEMFYLLVPDPTGIFSAARTKEFVAGVVVSTIAHELQHLINSSRRLYVNDAAVILEEPWLNEGLSHIAEELVFYRASGRTPRQNLGASALADPATRAAYDRYQVANFRRYLEYLRAPDAFSPVAENAGLPTRGAAWAFLRYVADRAVASDGDFWHRLVNSTTIGARNLDRVLDGTGLTTASALRDWSIAVSIDDLVATPPARRQASWNFLSGFRQVGITEWLAPVPVVSGTPLLSTIRGGSSGYARFSSPAGQDALLQVTGPGGTTIPGMRFTLVRIK